MPFFPSMRKASCIWCFMLCGMGSAMSVQAQQAAPAAVLADAPTWRKFLVDVRDVAPDIVLDIRYYTRYNFIGRRIDGYEAPKCLLTLQAAQALTRVQKELRAQSLSLKIYDCYRPQMAVDQFVLWAKDLDDTKMKSIFYPQVDKQNLFRDGYIAEKSGHSRGSTVDLTLMSLPLQKSETCMESAVCRDNSLDMGTPFDFFDPSSFALHAGLTPAQSERQQRLHFVMLKHGFKYLPEEWWHFTLVNEPYPDRYFNFPVQ